MVTLLNPVQPCNRFRTESGAPPTLQAADDSNEYDPGNKFHLLPPSHGILLCKDDGFAGIILMACDHEP